MRSMKAAGPLARDPAPSRTAYRLHRLWLTPFFRVLLRVGLPAFVIVFSIGLYLSNDHRRANISTAWAGAWDAVEDRPEFMVNLLAIDGASPALSEAVRTKLNLKLPVSSFDIDMDAAVASIEELDAVASAEMRLRTGGVLQVAITERLPVIIWRRQAELSLLDIEGRRVAKILARADRSDLPVVSGDGADADVAGALAILEAAGPISSRVRGLVRMGERRWDIVLDRDQRILLPEAGPIAALERVIALDKAEDLLDRDVLAIDMRDDARPVLRLAPYALGVLRQSQGIETGASSL